MSKKNWLGLKGPTAKAEGCMPPQELEKNHPQGGNFSSNYKISKTVSFVTLVLASMRNCLYGISMEDSLVERASTGTPRKEVKGSHSPDQEVQTKETSKAPGTGLLAPCGRGLLALLMILAGALSQQPTQPHHDLEILPSHAGLRTSSLTNLWQGTLVALLHFGMFMVDLFIFSKDRMKSQYERPLTAQD